MAKSRVIGLDIGTTHVRAAEVEFGSGGPARTAQPTVVRYGEVALPPGAIRDGEVAESSTVATAIRRLWSQHKFSHKNVVLGVGNQRVIVRDLDLPWMPIAQIRSSLPFQVQDMLPVAIEDAVLDYVPTGSFDGEHGRMLRGLLVAATKDTVHANTEAVESAGLRPMMVDLGALALTRVMARGDLAGREFALVDVGARVTTVVIVAGGQPRLIRMLPSGGQDVTEAVAGALGITMADAEVAKRQIGIGYAVGPELERGVEAIRTVTTSLIEAIRNTFVYYASSNPGSSAEVVVLTGGGSQLPGLGQYLSSACRVPVTVGQPLSTLKVAPGAGLQDGHHDNQHLLAIPLGLAFGVAA
ncbi:type IV pilus assembly protein PilM [Cellulomonas xylanilytica]|uniref:Fimbrial assembly protein n=1 Tax=Cellulomonas xylanilytica TaxID=233583 RepID=A0A510UZ68_9CELL|nr:type IV pilus assembly protein PilM [Cellulomonas xylanilytica]GEK19972.1 fimbrial assembly protein [Cellulomonas xylanilytica]